MVTYEMLESVRDSGHLIGHYDLHDGVVAYIRSIITPLPDDPELIRSAYPLSEEAAQRIATMIGVCIDTEASVFCVMAVSR